MAKMTPRDRAWSAALEIAEEKKDVDWSYRQRFGAADVEERIGEDAPSRRTIRDVLATMAELGHLETATKNGAYEPLEEQEVTHG
jgi:hypothetical protein